jgi:hypothetical protein
MLEVLGHYRLILVDKGIPLLKRVNGQPGLGRKLQDTRTITWGESILLPSAGGKGIWCTVEIRPSLTGRMRSFFYKPASGRTPQFDGFSFVTALNEWHCFQPAIKVSF